MSVKTRHHNSAAHREELADAINDIESGTIVLPGVWVLEDETDLADDEDVYIHTWDETAYSEIKLVFESIQPASDGVSFYLTIGTTNGTSMFESTSDYDGVELIWESTPDYLDGSDTDKIRLLPSCSNASNETISGEVVLSALFGTDLGCLVHAKLLYISSTSNQRAYEAKAFLDDGSTGAIDTVNLFFASGNFANTGTIRVYGLKR